MKWILIFWIDGNNETKREYKTFIEALNNLARGTISKNDIALIKTRESEKYVPKDAIKLYADNRSDDSYIKIDLKDSLWI